MYCHSGRDLQREGWQVHHPCTGRTGVQDACLAAPLFVTMLGVVGQDSQNCASPSRRAGSRGPMLSVGDEERTVTGAGCWLVSAKWKVQASTCQRCEVNYYVLQAVGEQHGVFHRRLQEALTSHGVRKLMSLSSNTVLTARMV